jgi:hypothetical protein
VRKINKYSICREPWLSQTIFCAEINNARELRVQLKVFISAVFAIDFGGK